MRKKYEILHNGPQEKKHDAIETASFSLKWSYPAAGAWQKPFDSMLEEDDIQQFYVDMLFIVQCV